MPAALIAVATAVGSGATLVCNKPTGTAQGDALIAFQFDDDGLHSALTAPAGWSLLTQIDKGTDRTHFKLWALTAGASEGASYTFGQHSGTDGAITMLAVRGADTNTTHWLYSSQWTANSTSRVCPSLTPVTGGGILICSACVDMNNTAVTFTPPTGMTEQSDLQPSVWSAQSVATLMYPPDPSGSRTFTTSSSTFFSTDNGIQASVFVPAAPGQFFAMF